MTPLKIKSCTHTFIFSKSEELTLAINCLYNDKSTRMLNSNLYLFNNKYYLTIFASANKSILKINEFSDNYSTSTLLITYLNEYAKKLINQRAIFIYGKAFSKYS